MSKEHQRHINKYFPNRPILYQPGLAKTLGSVNAGILLSQLLYWHKKGINKDGWIYKTAKEMEQETGLSRSQQETAIRICRDLDILDYKIAGIPAKRHFRVKLEILENILPSLKKKVKVDFINPPYRFAESPQTITESTPKTTSETTSEITNNRFSYSNSFSSIGSALKDHPSQELLGPAKSNDFDRKEY